MKCFVTISCFKKSLKSNKNKFFGGKVLPHLCLLVTILRARINNVANQVEIYVRMFTTFAPLRNCTMPKCEFYD